MRYMCLVHFEPSRLDNMPPADRKAFDRRSMAYDKELEAKGHYLHAEAIQGGDSAVLVRVRDGRMSTTDGPYIETKEQMAGFVLIEARDMNEAIRLASGIPLAELGTIEVRPVYLVPDPQRLSDIEAIYRAERGRVLASLIRLLGGFELAEEALADAFLAASRQWPRDGVPANPRAWLVSAGRFKAIDRLRQRARQQAVLPELLRNREAEEAEMPAEAAEIADDTLRLIFICCHPALPPDAQIALTLREVCGLTTEAIAAAYLAKPAAIAQRIVRAKTRIRDEALPYEVPTPGEWSERLDTVLHTLYLIFGEGYDASSGDALIRRDLCDEAIRLARLLKALHPSPDIDGLLALMLLHQSRATTRADPSGDIVLLEDQDRTKWDSALIAEGTTLAQLAFAAPPVGSYTIQAMIAATHAAASAAAQTDWRRIVSFYDLLLRAEPGPITALNRAVAIAMRDGPEAGLALIDPLAAGDLATYRFAHAARADLLRRLGRNDEAHKAYEATLALTTQEVERRFIAKRIAEL